MPLRQEESHSRHRPLLSSHQRRYTPALLPLYPGYNATGGLRDFDELPNLPPLSSCADVRLTDAEARACRACAAIRGRDACLAAKAVTYYGADTDSCTWVGKGAAGGRSVEVALSTGVNGADARFLAVCASLLTWPAFEGHDTCLPGRAGPACLPAGLHKDACQRAFAARE